MCLTFCLLAINNSANAGLLAVRMLAVHDGSLLEKMIAYQQKLKDTVLQKSEKLNREGWEHYKPE
jgi:phosphoribosylcarboxyaminoimidazole (NCAIR) mutase